MSSMPSLIVCLGLSVCLLGCTSEKSSPEKESATESLDKEPKDSNQQSVSYEEGKGLLLKKEAAEAIGLKSATVSEQDMPSRIQMVAQVYMAAGDPAHDHNQKQRSAYASAVIPAEMSKLMKGGDRITLIKGMDELFGELSKLSPSPGGGTHQTTLTLEIIDPKKLLHVGEFIQATVKGPQTKRATVSIPRQALLETITGTFVFLEREGHLLRIPVTTGTTTSDSVEITEGLTLGDKIVTAPVELIYLTELRLTKGGGHAD